MFADRSGYLYCQVDAKAYAMAVDQGTGVWIELPFEGPVELGGNAGGGVFACSKEGGSSVFCRMNGLKAERFVGHSSYDLGAWYVDGVGRVWLQTLEEDGRGLKDLVVLQEGNDARVIQSRPSVYATRIRRPCEYKPGHVVLFFKTSMIWATPTEIDVREPPRFASDGTGQGPLPLGEHFLVSGGSNNIGMGSYLIDTRHPDEPARRLGLGWDWFWPVASAPDGRALVIAQTDQNPRYTLFWYAPDGNSQVRLEGADDVLRAGLLHSVQYYSPRGGIVCFDSGNNGYAALQDGLLAVFEADRARLLTPADGLPWEKVVDVAMLGDRLAMVDADGRVVLWQTRVPLEQTAEDDFARRRRWRLAGPCAIGADGNLWAFLAAFPGRISRFDGRRWEHRRIDLGTRRPMTLTADDLGNLQIGFISAPAGSDLVTASGIESWKEGDPGWEDDSLKAWKESLRRGATRFFDGSPERTRHWTNGRWLWLYEGCTLWDGETEVDYYPRPDYSRWWADPDGTWYRDGRQLNVYRSGRWRTMTERPSRLLLGPNGLRSYDPAVLQQDPNRFLQVESGSSGRLIAHAPHVEPPRTDEPSDVSCVLQLSGNEVYLQVASGGGWVGEDRYFQGVFFYPGNTGKIFEASFGRFILDLEGNEEFLSFHPHRRLELKTKVEKTAAGWKIRPDVADVPVDEELRFLVFVNGEPHPRLLTAETLEFSAEQYATADVVLWAVDAAGNLSAEPAAVRLARESGKQPLLPRDGPRPQWTVLPKQVEVAGVAYRMGISLAVADDGTVFVTATRVDSSEYDVLALSPDDSGWARVPGPVQHQPRPRLASTLDGRVFAVWAQRHDALEIPVFSVTPWELRLVTQLYNDSSRETRFAWDDQGNLWNLGLRWIGRWDKARWTEWTRPVGWRGRVVTFPGGRAVVLCEGHFYIYENGKLGQKQVLPDGWVSGTWGFALGERRLVLHCRSDDVYGMSRWAVYDLVEGTLDLDRFRQVYSLWSDGQGNVIAFEGGKRRLRRIHGDDLSEQAASVPLDCRPETSSPSPHRVECLGTQRGTTFFLGRYDGIITWADQEEFEKHDWRRGVPAGLTTSAQEAGDGRVWILRAGQVLVYDPDGDPELNSQPFAGWEEIYVAGPACPGFHGKVWYWKLDGCTAACTDGETESTWKVDATSQSGLPSIEVVSDQGEALARDTRGRFLLLQNDGVVDHLESAHRGVLKMVRRGAAKFQARQFPPVIAADGSIYFEGRLYDGNAWRETHTGRAFLDTVGQLMLIIYSAVGRSYVYRYPGTTPEDVGTSKRYLLDSVGLRWYDPGLLEAQPGRFPIVTHGDRGQQLSLTPDGESYGPVSNPVRAIPCGEDTFLIETQHSGPYLLGPERLVKIDDSRLPFGKHFGKVHPMVRGRWAWISGSSIFISPPDTRWFEESWASRKPGDNE